jgi:hypothetical protein
MRLNTFPKENKDSDEKIFREDKVKNYFKIAKEKINYLGASPRGIKVK